MKITLELELDVTVAGDATPAEVKREIHRLFQAMLEKRSIMIPKNAKKQKK